MAIGIKHPVHPMDHSSRDSHDVQSLKRIWWNLKDLQRAFPDELIEHENIVNVMQDVETVVLALTHGKKALSH